MSNQRPPLDDTSIVRARKFDRLCDEFESQYLAGNRPSIDTFLAHVDVTNKHQILAELIAIDMHYRRKLGESVAESEYYMRFPDFPPSLLHAIIHRDVQTEMPLSSKQDGNSSGPVLADKELDGITELRKYLMPPTRPGWIGRLAHYEIEQLLGRGAFGIVVKAFDEKLHRVVAIKFLNPELASTSPPRKRFLREARAAAAVRHENIVGIYAVEEEPLPYLVMEFVPGVTLQQWLDQNGPLDVIDILWIGQQLASGIGAAHAASLIHRDIKPSNILLEPGIEKKAKISDFGLARAVDDASLTSSGLIAGTPMYMAPEQARGEVLDHRADLFSLGSVLYQMTSGRPPFRAASTVAVLKRVCEDTPRSIQDVIPGTPIWLSAIIGRLLEKKPADRFQSAKEVAYLFERCQTELKLNGVITCDGSLYASNSQSADRESLNTVSDEFVGASQFPTQELPERNVKRTPSNRMLFFIASIFTISVITAGMLMNIREGIITVPEKSTSERIRPETQFGQPETSKIAVGFQDLPRGAPLPAIAPFTAEQAKQYQDSWAKYLNIDVGFTNSIGMKFMLIPPGSFLMGSTPDQVTEAVKFGVGEHWQECIKSEEPRHHVVLSQPIYLGVTEVTQSEYKKVMGINPSCFAPTGAAKDFVVGVDTSNYPVEMVSWNDAAEFCAKLSDLEDLKPYYLRAGETVKPLDGTGYRLPTEAEWEFSCRAGTIEKYWTSDNDDELLWTDWFAKNSRGVMHAVGKLRANPLGLQDVHGSVAEWVQDSWLASYYEQSARIPAINPQGPYALSFSPAAMRVNRGGSWGVNSACCRSSSRLALEPTACRNGVGFRVAMVIHTRTMQPYP